MAYKRTFNFMMAVMAMGCLVAGEWMAKVLEPKILTSLSEVLPMWAAHESGRAYGGKAVLPNALGNFQVHRFGVHEARQCHEFVSKFRTYEFSYPVLWWAFFMGNIGHFDAQVFYRVNRRELAASHWSGMNALGYVDHMPGIVLERFLGCVQRRLDREPLNVWPMVEAKCEADELSEIAEEVNAEVDRKYQPTTERF